MRRVSERDIPPMARHFGMALAPWDVLGSGHFQSAKQLEERTKQGERLRSIFGLEQTEDERRVSEALAMVPAEHEIESATAIALPYVVCKAPNVFPIVGGRKIEHLNDNIQALSIRLMKNRSSSLSWRRRLILASLATSLRAREKFDNSTYTAVYTSNHS